MKANLILSIALMSLCSHNWLFADETWSFDQDDGVSIEHVLSDRGSSFGSSGSPIVWVENKQLRFTYDGQTGHTFRQQAFAGTAINSGILELSWTFGEVDFSRTAASGGSANIGFDVRDLSGTRQVPRDDVVFGGVRLRCEKGGVVLQSTQNGGGDSKAWAEIRRFDSVHFSGSVSVRLRFDLDRRNEAGAFQVFVITREGNEECVLDDGVLPLGGEISGFRIIQQTTNGRNSWEVGDHVSVDDFAMRVL